MFEPGVPVVVMVSGGADSVAALLMVAEQVFGELRPLVVHVNHRLRDAESDGDEAFVRELAGRLRIDVRVLGCDVAACAASEKLNLEDAGRRIRYRFAQEALDAHCQRLGVSASSGRLLVAHTLDDRIETFFMRALLGAGLGGLSSIAPVRGRIVRPLLETERLALRQWLGHRSQSWREDSSNSDTTRLRAHIRATLLPTAEQVNPAFRAALSRTMDLLADDDNYLSGLADSLASELAETEPDQEVCIDRHRILGLDRALARRVIRSSLLNAFPDASRIPSAHIRALAEGFGNDRFSHDLPGGLKAFSEYDKMVVVRQTAENPCLPPGCLQVPGVVELGRAGSIIAEQVPGPAGEHMRAGSGVGSDDGGRPPVSGQADAVVIDAQCVADGIYVDSVRAGDRMRPLGMQGSRKLSDLLIDAKVPRRKRALIPVVRDGERIIWLAGIRLSDEYRVTESTSAFVRLVWNREREADR